MKKHIGNRLAELNRLMIRNIICNKLFCSCDAGQSDSITMANSCIICYLYDNRNIDVYQRDIEEEFGIRRSTVSKELSLMEQKGFIQRQSLSHDKRLKKIVLCEKTLPLAEKIISDRLLLEQKMISGISEADLENFYKTLDKITDNLREDNV